MCSPFHTHNQFMCMCVSATKKKKEKKLEKLQSRKIASEQKNNEELERERKKNK